jgi:Flp pilus assembly protein TadD
LPARRRFSNSEDEVNAIARHIRGTLVRQVPPPQSYPSPAQGIQDALAHLQRGELAQAGVICERILQRRPRDLDALNCHGIVKAQSGRKAEAIELFERAVSSHPRDARSHNNLGKALAELGRFEEALELL